MVCRDFNINWNRIILGALIGWVTCLFSIQFGFAATTDDDTPVEQTEERSSRVEQLRSRTPSSTYGSGSYSPALPPPGLKPAYGTPPPAPRQMAPEINTPRFSSPAKPLKPIEAYKPSPLATPKPSEPNLRFDSQVRIKKKAQGAKQEKPAPLVANQQNRKLKKSTPKDRRCGFCLMNGVLYCGEQSITLDNLIKKNQGRIGRKNQGHSPQKRYNSHALQNRVQGVRLK